MYRLQSILNFTHSHTDGSKLYVATAALTNISHVHVIIKKLNVIAE